MEDLKRFVAQQLHDSQSQYTYFLLAAAASGIALAVQRTSGTEIHVTLIPLGLAVVSWGASFWCGCQNRGYFSSAMYANHALLQLQSGTHPEQPGHPELTRAAIEGVKIAAERNSQKTNRYSHWQFRLLIVGAILFIAWHVTVMALPDQKEGSGDKEPNQALQTTPMARSEI